ncbi:hypothetical protein E4T48_00019 [Aureobasidium sp. EXF-10727]|nr:hypothetical protein E4T48_00019 [Aureobasidium sp. EXF-10727]
MSLWRPLIPETPSPKPYHCPNITPTDKHSYYTSLSPKTRLIIGGSIIGYATLGLFVSDAAEEKLGYTPTEADKKRLREAMPRIRVVEE